MNHTALFLAALVSSMGVPAHAGPAPARDSARHVKYADSCRPGTRVGSTAFRSFGSSGFGRLFRPHVPIGRLSADLAIHGYDFIGTDQGYALFYRRPLAIYRIASLAPALSPQGYFFSAEINPELNAIFPPPFLLAHQWPFNDAVILPQQIVAFPCGQIRSSSRR